MITMKWAGLMHRKGRLNQSQTIGHDLDTMMDSDEEEDRSLTDDYHEMGGAYAHER